MGFVTMQKSLRGVAAGIAAALALAACGGGGSGGGGIVIFPTPAPTLGPGTNPLAFTCPTSTTSFSVARSAATMTRRSVPRASGGAMTTPGLLVVSYDTARMPDPSVLDARASALGARAVSGLRFGSIGRAARVVSVEPARADVVAAQLRALPGVLAVTPSQRLRALAVSGPYLTNDPYFRGESGSAPPLYETNALPGQWDMHVTQLGDAFAYSQPNNGSLRTNPSALGSRTVKLAVIDTGADVRHPDLSGGSVVLTRCFITSPSGVQSTSGFATDPMGHGTDVTGIAGASVNNGFGFAGAAGNVSLMIYRVFPTPDDNCTNENTTDPQCGTADVDLASAIDDAVQNGANVISLSLGGGPCVNGADPDPIEGNAIANAVAHNVIVVAAAGNAGGSGVDAPGCDPGVIAVGASAYNDGTANGSGYSGANREYVASYSQYGSTNAPRNAASWGIVAPGGDPSGSSDIDDLHWIENIWTSTPFDANFAGFCGADAFGESNNCRTLIAGTSMATPHVAGAAALVLSVSGVAGPYGSPNAMRTLLCSTADDIGDPHQGCGRLNVYRAVATALGDPTLP
ncbi:MAG: S8 family serine peptidase [bacterium]|nr:S8 family serine peptidase [bacterium]